MKMWRFDVYSNKVSVRIFNDRKKCVHSGSELRLPAGRQADTQGYLETFEAEKLGILARLK